MTDELWQASNDSLADMIVLSLPNSALPKFPDPDFEGFYAVKIGGETSRLWVIHQPNGSPSSRDDGHTAAVLSEMCLYQLRDGDFGLVCIDGKLDQTIVCTGHGHYHPGLPE